MHERPRKAFLFVQKDRKEKNEIEAPRASGEQNARTEGQSLSASEALSPMFRNEQHRGDRMNRVEIRTHFSALRAWQ